jgi:drug/metabolite transporter (DMT)-like permease
LKEELRARFWLWAGVAIAGAYAVSFPNLAPKLFEGETFNPNLMGVALAMTAAALWGAGTVLGKYVLSSASFQTMTALRFLIAFVFLLGMNAYQKSFPSFGAVSAKTWLYIVIIAVTSGVVSLFIYYKGLTHTKASIATLAELGFPLAAVLVNYFALRIELQPMQIFGMSLLLFAIFNLTKVNRQETENFAMASGNQG